MAKFCQFFWSIATEYRELPLRSKILKLFLSALDLPMIEPAWN